MNGDFQRHLPGHRVSGATEAWIIGTECHLDHVEQTFVDLATFDEILRGFLGGHLDRRVVIGGAHDQVDLGEQTLFIRPVVMRERTAVR